MDNHHEFCRCWQCTTNLLGEWFDELGRRTASGGWDYFVTISYRTNSCPWKKGFPVQHWKPSAEFAANFFKFFIKHFEKQLGEPLDFAVADQYGKLNGRLHQHCLLAGRSLNKAMRPAMQSWLTDKAGFSKVLPFEEGAAFYISRYIGRSAPECEWDISVGEQEMKRVSKPEVWGQEVVVSAEMPKSAFHQGLPGRKR